MLDLIQCVKKKKLRPSYIVMGPSDSGSTHFFLFLQGMGSVVVKGAEPMMDRGGKAVAATAMTSEELQSRMKMRTWMAFAFTCRSPLEFDLFFLGYFFFRYFLPAD